MKDWQSMPRGAQVMLYVVGVIDGLKAKGFVEGGRIETTDEGREKYVEMVKAGFRPTDAEMKSCLDYLMGPAQAGYALSLFPRAPEPT